MTAKKHIPSPIASHADLAGLDPDLCVIKLGSAALTTDVGRLDPAVLDQVARFASERLDRGKATLIVSSGAVAAGIGRMEMDGRPKRVPELQALAAVGQGRLMDAWSDAFERQGRATAQVLVSAADFRDRRRYLNMRYTLDKLFEWNVIPVVNENDTITIEELRFGDNDGLAQLIAIKMLAGLLIFLTEIGGLYRRMPSRDDEGELVEVVRKVTPEILAMASGERSRVGSGGMNGKLEAAGQAAQAGIPVLIASGKEPGVLDRLLSGQGGGTLFAPSSPSRLNRRQRYIAFSRVKPHGQIWIDAGAVRALTHGKKSLLPAGASKTDGRYDRQDIVEVLDPSGAPIARGITNYSSGEVAKILGRRSGELEEILGTQDYYDEIIHRDNLVIL